MVNSIGAITANKWTCLWQRTVCYLSDYVCVGTCGKGRLNILSGLEKCMFVHNNYHVKLLQL